MLKKFFSNRLSYLGLILLLVGGLFGSVLFDLQVVQGDSYREQADASAVYTMDVSAARGEIVDRNGVALATNRVGYNVQFNKLFLPSEDLNETILKLCGIMTAKGQTWNDTLPISKSEPYGFLTSAEEAANAGSTENVDVRTEKELAADIESLKKTNDLNVYATAENVMDKLIEKYELKKYSRQDARTIAGVRYEMELRGYFSNTPYTYASDISIEAVTAIEEASMQMPGVGIVEEAIREYPNGTLLPHLLGHIGSISKEEYEELAKKGYKLNDVVGKDGVEKAYESTLKGTAGQVQVVKDKSGNVLSQTETKAPQPGGTVQLTIDANLQGKTQEILERYIKNIAATKGVGVGADANAGAAVVLNTKTGEVLAMANYPTYDINNFFKDYNALYKDPLNPMFNRALDGTYTPGSVFKPCVGLAALSAGTINPSTSVTCNHVYTYFDGYSPECLGTHGPISLKRALAVSCNIYFYEVGRQVGIQKIFDTAHQLGLGEDGESLGFELGGVTGSKISHPDNYSREWVPGDIVQAAIGQGETIVTPLQLATYAATMSNNGTRYKSHLIKGVLDHNTGATIYETKPTVAAQVEGISDEDYAAVREGMVAVSREGSGRPGFQNYPIDVASKTGTPQVPNGSPNAVYIAYGPAENSEIAVAVVIEHGGDSYYLSPMVAEIMNAYFYPDGQAAQ